MDIHKDDLLSALLESCPEEEAKKLKKLSSQIKLNEAISGVKFETAEWEVTNKGKSSVESNLRQQNVRLSFKVRERWLVNPVAFHCT